jgi:hypothetical protein
MGIQLDLTKSSPTHPTEEILEEYVLLRLPEALAAPLEEHLLLCHSCQDALAETDRFVSDLKIAGKRPNLAHHPAPAASQVRSGWWDILNALPRLATKTSLVLALAIMVLLVVRQNAPGPIAPVAVSLSALRGMDPLSPAPAGKPLQLNIQSPDLAPDRALPKAYHVELVDAAGGAIWKGSVTEADGKLVATMSKSLRKGVYWVRLYGPDSELLREFGLLAK